MTVWRIAIDENGRNSSYSEFKTRRVAAIGWRDIGSFAPLVGQPRAAIETFAQQNGDAAYGPVPNVDNYWWFGTPKSHPNPYQGHRTHIGRIFDYFVNGIRQGDLVLAHVGLTCVGIAEICPSSHYLFDANYEYANSTTSVSWVDLPQSIAVSNCRFLGICKVGRDEAQKIVGAWQQFKQRTPFQPC